MPRIDCLVFFFFFEYPRACLFFCFLFLFCVLFYFIYFYCLCVHFIFEKFQKDKKYSIWLFFLLVSDAP
jgi:hypothetical protein